MKISREQHGSPGGTAQRSGHDPVLADPAEALKIQLRKGDPGRYAELVSNVSSFGIYLIDRRGMIQTWNQGAEKLTRLRPADVIGMPFDELFLPEARSKNLPRRTLTAVLNNKHHRDEQIRRRGQDGQFLASCSFDAVRSESGEIIGFVEVFHDITDQRNREEMLYRQATQDVLTGIANRGHFLNCSNLEFERAQRFRDPLSVLMLDIDHFKKINDTYGHAAGDEAIIQVATLCSASVRKIDIVGRFGGEEFAVTLPRANSEPAFEMAAKLRRKIADTPVQFDGKTIFFTISIGVASLRPDVLGLPELLRNADAALYQAKREGRNQVVAWTE